VETTKNQTRKQAVGILYSLGMIVKTIASAIGVSNSTVSHDLKELGGAKVFTNRPEGSESFSAIFGVFVEIFCIRKISKNIRISEEFNISVAVNMSMELEEMLWKAVNSEVKLWYLLTTLTGSVNTIGILSRSLLNTKGLNEKFQSALWGDQCIDMLSPKYREYRNWKPLPFLFEIFSDKDLLDRCKLSIDHVDLAVKVNEIFIEKTVSPMLAVSFGKVWGDSFVSAGALDEGEDFGNLSFLSEREKDVIGMWYGFKDGKNYSLEDISDKVELTRERVRQIKENALKRIRKHYDQKGITFPVNFFFRS